MLQQYDYLPGVESILLDSRVKISEPPRITDSVLILGTAEDGPLMRMVRIGRASEIGDIFGRHVDDRNVHNGATLTPAYNEAYGNGARTIYFMRITGQYATLALENDDLEPAEQVIIRSRHPGDSYNNVQVAVTADELHIWSRGQSTAATPTRKYVLANYNHYGELQRAVNADAALHDVVLVLADGISESDPIDLAEVAKTKLTGGDSEMRIVDDNPGPGEIKLGAYDEENTYRGRLAAAYEIVQNAEVDWVVPTGVYITYDQGDFEGTPNFLDAQVLAEALRNMDRYEHPAKGVIGIARLDNPTVQRVTKLGELLINNPPSITQDGQDIGHLLSIVAAEPTFFDADLGIYSNSGAAAYAGLAANLPPHHATTNTPMPGLLSMRWNFPVRQLDQLTGSGYVTFRTRTRRGIVPTDDPTAASRESDYASLSTIRIAQDVVRLVRTVAEPYLGRPITNERKTALENDIDVGLDSRRKMGMLNYYDFRLYSSIEGYLRGFAEVELTLVPTFILKRLRIRVSLRPDTL